MLNKRVLMWQNQLVLCQQEPSKADLGVHFIITARFTNSARKLRSGQAGAHEGFQRLPGMQLMLAVSCHSSHYI